jgi:aminobenzoyl-glutamate utilization protein B
MDMRHSILNRLTAFLCASAVMMPLPVFAAAPPEMKQEAATLVDQSAKQVQVMIDQVFSFGEPGYQEIRTSAYLTGILEKNGFKITHGVAGIPTAWTATWGDGGPLIAMGSDEDDLRGLSQYPGLTTLKPMVEGAPGHGEGHNTGMPLQITAALAVKAIMEKNHIKGRLMLWPGIAEELLGSKAYYVRAGLFKDVDACIFVHVGNGLGTSWGPTNSTGMVSVEYTFHGKSAHAAADPWDGRSALSAVEVMDVAWSFRREVLHISQRSHRSISNGGDQPNVVPSLASVWYYFREHDFASVKDLYETGNTIAEAAAMATGTTVTHQLLGEAASQYGNRPLAEAAYENIKAVGMPKWTDADQAFAKSVQVANNLKVAPLRSEVNPLLPPRPASESTGGASDDIGDVMWNVPTITVNYPSNIPSAVIHSTIAAMSVATPIAHKGAVAGAKVVAMTVLDLMTTPEILTKAKDFFQNVQTKDQKYVSLLGPDDQPAIHINDELMGRVRPAMEKFYYNPAKYATYLDQLGIQYPSGVMTPPAQGKAGPPKIN